MICELCEEKFEEGEAMVNIPAIGHMHQSCKPVRIQILEDEDE